MIEIDFLIEDGWLMILWDVMGLYQSLLVMRSIITVLNQAVFTGTSSQVWNASKLNSEGLETRC